MHTPLIAGAYFTLACWLCVGGVVSLVAHLLKRRNADYLLYGLMSFVVAVHAVGSGISCMYGNGSDAARWAMGSTVAFAAATIAAALHVHFALRYAGAKRQVAWALVAYLIAGTLEILILRGEGLMMDQAEPVRLLVMGLDVTFTQMPHSTVAYSYLVLPPVGHVIACILFGRAYLKGRREGLTMFIGAGVFTLTAVNDTLVHINAIRGLPMLPVGLMLFSFAMSLAFLRRYTIVREEFSRQAKALNERSKQLRQARHVLRELQSELGRKEQLAAIGEMAAVIAHEVRNPLAVISNAVASLRREGLSRHDHDVLLSILDEEAVRLNRLVSDLLSYARPINLQRQRVVLHDLSQRATIMHTHQDARVIYDESSVRGQIWGDANLLRQVFDNLVENAVQATGGTGIVTLAVKPASRETADGFLVTVTDDGEGMDTQVRNRAKDPFFTTRPSGTGLGLAIVSRIVEAHGGDITFESRAGEGTTVSVFLPIGTESTPPPEPRRDLDTMPPLGLSGEGPAFHEFKD